MKRKIELALLAAVVAAALGLLVLTGPGTGSGRTAAAARSQAAATAEPQAEELSIRNLTKARVTYLLTPTRGKEPPTKSRTIAPGDVQRVRTAVPLEVRFSNGREEMAFTLDPGRSYTFRYDEDKRVQIFQGAHGRTDAADLAPYVPTPQTVVDRMLELAAVTRDDVVYDLGCGDGRIVITAARRFGARGVGIDIDASLVRQSKANALAQGVSELVRFLTMDVTKADFSQATVVAVYLLPESNEILRPKFEKQLKPGTRIVCHNYTVPGWAGAEVLTERLNDETGEEHKIYLYRR